MATGGAPLWFPHSGHAEWLLIALASIVHVAIASATGRSSYAVLAAIGLLLVTTHFVHAWFGAPLIPYLFEFEEASEDQPWAGALLYAGYGLVLMLLGLWLARRRGLAEPV